MIAIMPPMCMDRSIEFVGNNNLHFDEVLLHPIEIDDTQNGIIHILRILLQFFKYEVNGGLYPAAFNGKNTKHANTDAVCNLKGNINGSRWNGTQTNH